MTNYSYTVDPTNALSHANNRFEVVIEDVTLGINEGNLVYRAISFYPNPV